MYYTALMSTTLTVRTDAPLRKALEERARLRGTSVSALVRQILEEAVSERPLGDRIGHLRGTLEPAEAEPDGWERHLREQNWRG